MRLFITSMLLLGFCLPIFAEKPQGRPQMPPPTVIVGKVIQIDNASPREYVGTVIADDEVNIIPRITGFIKKVNFIDGQIVKKGDLLYEIESTSYVANVNVAKAQIAQIQADLLYNQKQLKRNEPLEKKNAIAASTLDSYRKLVKSSEAKLAEMKAHLLSVENDLSYTKIYAPLSGRIGFNKYSVGSLVTPATGTLTDIKQVSPILVEFALGERMLRSYFGGLKEFAKNATLQIKLADGKIFNEVGKVANISNQIDTSTNTISVRIKFLNKNMELISGSYITVLLSKKLDKPLMGVLLSAIMIDDKGTYVYVIDKNNKVSRRNVKTSGVNGNYQEIISGVKVGEYVITDGTNKVGYGVTTVNPVNLKKDN